MRERQITGSRMLLGVNIAIGMVALVAAATVAQGQTYALVHSFGAAKDGTDPYAGVIADRAGNVYGTTKTGGTYGYGTVFRLNASGNELILHHFTGGSDGAYPQYGTLIRDASGNLYGTTTEGGSLSGPCAPTGCGVVFELTDSQRENVLYTFSGGSDGAKPDGGLTLDSEGNLYGTTAYGGVGYGVVFEVSASGTDTVLYTFSGGSDGANPTESLIRDSAGNLYGTTSGGGLSGACGGTGCGVVFKLDPTENETVLYTFTGSSDGEFPSSPLIQDSAGNLYGETVGGGNFSCGFGYGCGVVFEVSEGGLETALYAFSGSDGEFPGGGLVRGASGELYGTTTAGGSDGFGTIFRLDSNDKEIVLYNFTGMLDGADPIGGLVAYRGSLYGTAAGGGFYIKGVAFKLSLR